jgi:hypothetical protein
MLRILLLLLAAMVFANAAQAANVTLLFVYSPGARDKMNAYAGSVSQWTKLALEQLNRAHSISNTGQTVSLSQNAAGTWSRKLLTNYVKAPAGAPQGDSLGNDLVRLQADGDGYMDKVHEWRDEYAADVVIGVFDYSPGEFNTGQAWVQGTDFADEAFLVVDVDRAIAIGDLILGHEMGHLYGCAHESAAISSRGYCEPGNQWHDLMAISCPNVFSTRLNFWSANISIVGRGMIGDFTHNCAAAIPYFSNRMSTFR